MKLITQHRVRVLIIDIGRVGLCQGAERRLIVRPRIEGAAEEKWLHPPVCPPPHLGHPQVCTLTWSNEQQRATVKLGRLKGSRKVRETSSCQQTSQPPVSHYPHILPHLNELNYTSAVLPTILNINNKKAKAQTSVKESQTRKCICEGSSRVLRVHVLFSIILQDIVILSGLCVIQLRLACWDYEVIEKGQVCCLETNKSALSLNTVIYCNVKQ